jgi:uncharacterized protein
MNSDKSDYAALSQMDDFDLPVPFLHQVIELAVRLLEVKKIWVFGSRAKGTHRKNSDVDLAFEFEKNLESRWSELCVDLEENGLALVKIDCVDLTRCQLELRQEILSTGKLVYEKNAVSTGL